MSFKLLDTFAADFPEFGALCFPLGAVERFLLDLAIGVVFAVLKLSERHERAVDLSLSALQRVFSEQIQERSGDLEQDLLDNTISNKVPAELSAHNTWVERAALYVLDSLFF